MAISYKGPQYLNIATASAKRASDKKNWWMEGLMDAVDDKVEDANRLGRNFISTISDNFKTQLEYDADYKDAENKHKELANLTGYDTTMKEYIMKALINKTKTYQQLESHIIDGDFIPVSKADPENIEVASAKLPADFYTNLSNKLAESESSNRWDVSTNITTGSCKGGKAIGRWQFTACPNGKGHLDEFRNRTGAKFSNEQFRKSEDLQRAAMEWSLKNTEKIINKFNLDKFIGRKINGVTVTREGMFAVAHLGGNGALKTFLRTNGRNDKEDQFGTSLTKYMAKFGNGESVSTKSKLLDMFSTGGLAKKKAIKIAMKNLGLSESQAINMLEGNFLNQANFLEDSKVTIGGKLPDISGVTTLAEWEAQNTQFELNKEKLQKSLGSSKFNEWFGGSWKDHRKKLLDVAATENWSKNVNDPKWVSSLTLKEAKNILAMKPEKQGAGFLTKHIETLNFHKNDLDRMPAAPTSLDGIPSWIVEVNKVWPINRPNLVTETMIAVESQLKALADEKRLLDLTNPTQIMMQNLINSPAYIKANKEGRDDLLIKHYIKIKEAEQSVKDQKPITTEAEALVGIYSGNDTVKTASEQFLSALYDQDIKTQRIWVDVDQAYLDSIYGENEKNVDNYKNYKRMVLTYKRFKDSKFQYYPASTLSEWSTTTEPTAVIGIEIDEKAQNRIWDVTKNSTEFAAYNESLVDIVSFSNSLYNLVELVADTPEALLNSAGSTASLIQNFQSNVNAFGSMFSDLLKTSRQTTTITNPDGTTEQVDYVSREDLEQGLIDQGIFDEGDTFDSVLIGDIGKIDDIASARKRFLAESVMVIFKTGQLMGQTGQGMSNKDFDRFSAFIRGFTKPEDFEKSVKNFMKDQIDVNKARASLFNNPESNPAIKGLNIGFIPLTESGLVQNVVEFINKNGDENAKNKLNYFLGDESIVTLESSPQEVELGLPANPHRFTGTSQEEFNTWLSETVEDGHYYTILQNGQLKVFIKGGN